MARRTTSSAAAKRHRDNERLIRRIAFPRTSTKCSSGGRVLLHAQTLSPTLRAPISGIVSLAARLEFYELALYKLGWNALQQESTRGSQKYIALLDYKVSIVTTSIRNAMRTAIAVSRIRSE